MTLIMQDFGGVHSANMERTSARLLKGGTWKKQRVIVVLPAAASIPAKVALSHWNLAFPPNQPVVRILALGMEVGDAYSSALDGILAHPELNSWEFMLTIEHDNCPPPDGLVKLIEAMENNSNYACIGGLYFTKGDGGVAQIWGDPRDPILNFRPQVPHADCLQECVGTGMGFNLWRLSMFKDNRLQKPWFKTAPGATQDLAFWTDARKYGYRCAIDTRIKVGHYDLEGRFGPPDTMY